ncbi:MAG: hypothetical protein ACPGJS_06660 [Flammeovirgaceae bacterium]
MSSNHYHHIKQLIEQMNAAQTEEEYLVVLQQLHRLDIPPDLEWLIPYYACLTCILLSMLELHIDKRDEYIDDAESFLKRLLLLKSRDPETHILHAFWYQAKIMIAVLTRGPLYIGEIERLLEKAQALDPQNPRVYFLKAQAAYNKPRIIGGGKKKALPLLLKAKAKYATYIPPHELSPNWGEEQTLSMLTKIS